MTDAAESLDRHLSTFAASTGFVVDSKEKAAWAARLVARNDRQLRESETVMNTQVAAIGEWFEAEKRRCDTGYLREMLVRYHRTLVAQELADGVSPDRVRKTLPLPDGVTVERRAARTSVVVDDETALPSDCVTYAPVVVKTRIAELFRQGEHVPGARLVVSDNADPDGYTWAVRISAPKEDGE